MIRAPRVAGLLPLAILAFACGGEGAVTPAPVASVTVVVTGGETVLAPAEARQLTATAYDAGGVALPDRAITWSTSSAAVAVVSTSGLVTGVAPGGVTITATSEGRAASAALVVRERVASVAVEGPPQWFTQPTTVGRVIQFTATVRGPTGAVLDGRAVAWATSAPAVVSVTGAGLVTAVGPGTARVTATSEGVTGSVDLAVLAQRPCALGIEGPPGALAVAQAYQLRAYGYDPVEGPGVPCSISLSGATWSTSDASIAAVDQSGRVTAAAPGQAIIGLALSNGQRASVTITVVP